MPEARQTGREKRAWVGWPFTQGGGLGGLALGYYQAAPPGLWKSGDSQQFSILREQLTQIERRADTGGTTMLAGVTHVILHLRLPEGAERQIRLHAEGCWTMGQKSHAMDDLEQKLIDWQAAQSTPAPA